MVVLVANVYATDRVISLQRAENYGNTFLRQSIGPQVQMDQSMVLAKRLAKVANVIVFKGAVAQVQISNVSFNLEHVAQHLNETALQRLSRQVNLAICAHLAHKFLKPV